MKTISICQPWAWLILNAGKDIENRDWKTNYRGPILIHAAKACGIREYMEAASFAREARHRKFSGLLIPPPKNLERGGIVGRAEIVDCVTESDSPWFMGKYGFVLKNVEPLPFLKSKGQLGLFETPYDL